MLPHFLLTSSIYRCLVCIWPVWRKPHQYKPDQPGRLRSRELEDTLQMRMGDMNEMIPDRRCSIWFSNKAEPGTSIRGAFEFLGGGTNHVVCVCAICDRVQLLTLPKGQSLSYVHCFIDFTFAFEIDHVQQGGERMESRGHSNLFVVCNKAHHKINLLNAE